MADLLQHYEAIYNAADALVATTIVPVSAHEDINNEATPLPFIAYRQETERGIFGTPNAGSNKVLRSTWVFSVYHRDLEDAIDDATDLINGLVDNDITVADGYTTSALTLIGMIPLFEADGPNYAVHVRFMWERSI